MRVVMGNCGWWEQKSKMLIAMKLNNDVLVKVSFWKHKWRDKVLVLFVWNIFLLLKYPGELSWGCTAGQMFQQARRAAALGTSSCRARNLVHMDGKFKVYNNLQAAVTPTYPFPSLSLIYAEIQILFLQYPLLWACVLTFVLLAMMSSK